LAGGGSPQHRHGPGFAVLRVVAVDPSPDSATNGDQTMQWEYKLFTETMDTDQLNALGAQGWELVMVVSPAHFVFHYFFKREVRG
jgi:hypothetical protein